MHDSAEMSKSTPTYKVDIHHSSRKSSLYEKARTYTQLFPNGYRLSGNCRNLRGLPLAASKDEFVRGRSAEEVQNDTARPIAVGIGNIAGGIVGALAGESISSTTKSGPTWAPNGKFSWDVGFKTSGRSGWIVQKVSNSWRAEDSAGRAVPSPFRPPSFYETWSVDSRGKVSPSSGSVNDTWFQSELDRGWPRAVKGHWSTFAQLFFTKINPASHGFKINLSAPSRALPTSKTAPAALKLGFPRLFRFAQGLWDSTKKAPNHKGKAGPV